MCGISGIFSHHITEEHEQLLDEIIESQKARGPDYQAKTKIVSKDSQLLLGHNRLSIIDLSENAHQPFWDITERYCLVYNGEIYNYIEIRQSLESVGLQFKTTSDTEVILNAFAYYGIAAVDRFRGPFAFALFDLKTATLWLCRDRFGIRPLYYIKEDQIIYFASSVSVLAKKLSLRPNSQYIAQGLNYLIYENGDEQSPYDKLLSLPAGSYMALQYQSKMKGEIKRYYNLSKHVETKIEQLSSISDDDLLSLTTQTLENSVRIRLRSDVPLAIALSGGLDSSSVAACVKQQKENIIGFSFSNPNEQKSEGPIVAKCANYLNMTINYVWPNPDEMIDALYKTLDIQEAPFSTLSVVAQYLLYKHVNETGIKVLLGGQGGDEVFMGYRKFLFFSIYNLIQCKKYLTTLKNMYHLMPVFFSEINSLGTYWRHRHRYLSQSKFSSLAWPFETKTPHLKLNEPNYVLWQRQLKDILQFSLPTLLRYEDRNAMGNSVESRLPFMDHHLVELGLALPECFKLHKGYGKWIIRKIMKNKLPDQLRLAKYKRGFDIPITHIVKAGLGRSIRQTLNKNISSLNDFFCQSLDVDNRYADQQLLTQRSAISEVITLLWLNKVL